jgi:hypothetical protein
MKETRHVRRADESSRRQPPVLQLTGVLSPSGYHDGKMDLFLPTDMDFFPIPGERKSNDMSKIYLKVLKKYMKL